MRRETASGVGKDLTGAGFLRQGVRFAKEGSFLELGPGLTQLIRAMTVSRSSTSAKAINMPFRHGILHGVDLGYANVIVAAKAWGALVAVGNHAIRRANTPPPQPFLGVRESLRTLAESAARMRALEQAIDTWQPRNTTELLYAPAKPGTPERLVEDLLRAWVDRRFGIMARCLSEQRTQDENALAGRIRKLLPDPPAGFLLIAIEDVSFAASVVRARLVWTDGGDSEVELRTQIEDGQGIAVIGTADSDWRVVSLWPLEVATNERRARRSKADSVRHLAFLRARRLG